MAFAEPNRIRITGVPTAVALVILVALLGVWLALRQPPAITPLTIRDRGELRVATLNAPTAYYLGAHGPEGLEYELANRFAKSLNVKLTIHAVANIQDLFADLANGRADLLAAGLSPAPAPDKASQSGNLVTDTYAELPQIVVYRRGSTRPKRLSDLSSDTAVLGIAGNAGDPAVTLRRLDEGDAIAAIIDANAFVTTRGLHPDVRYAFSIPQTRALRWVVPPGALELRTAVNAFFRNQSKSSQLQALIARTSSGQQHLDFIAIREFRNDLDARLAPLQQYFEEAATATGLDWRLLAAIGYQESQWQSDAVASTGASGVMMLMPETAVRQGVEDITEPRSNILAGARYVRDMHRLIPERIAEPDRTWLALAAYNVGIGHLEDARIITQMRGANPDSWNDVRDNLPLLANDEWNARVARGYARGTEPVRFVDRIRQYTDLLEWRTAARAPAAANTPNASRGSARAGSAVPRR